MDQRTSSVTTRRAHRGPEERLKGTGRVARTSGKSTTWPPFRVAETQASGPGDRTFDGRVRACRTLASICRLPEAQRTGPRPRVDVPGVAVRLVPRPPSARRASVRQKPPPKTMCQSLTSTSIRLPSLLALQILAIICTHTHTDKSLITCTVRTIICFRDDLHKHMLAHARLRARAGRHVHVTLGAIHLAHRLSSIAHPCGGAAGVDLTLDRAARTLSSFGRSWLTGATQTRSRPPLRLPHHLLQCT